MVVDLKTAFDWVQREKLSRNRKGKQCKEWKRIMIIYSETTSVVKINDTESEKFCLKKGVLQEWKLISQVFDIYFGDRKYEYNLWKWNCCEK